MQILSKNVESPGQEYKPKALLDVDFNEATSILDVYDYPGAIALWNTVLLKFFQVVHRGNNYLIVMMTANTCYVL
jgi:hypothetical protein